MPNDEKWMQRCLELASGGLGLVAPNPMVGAVIVHNEQILGEGYHHQFGGDHAEVMAVKASGLQKMPEDCTMYVNLEPCNHFGKTPPCSELLIEKGFRRLVIANRDSHNLVNGSGIKRLEEAGIEVLIGVLEKEGRFLNRRFFTFHEKNRPYVILKWAESQDGFMAPIDKSQKWISGNLSRQLVHKWRSEEAAIMIGKQTALSDNPRLTVRQWKGRNPLRLVLDRKLQIPLNNQVFNEEAQTMIFNESKNESREQLEWIKLDYTKSVLPEIMNILHQRQIQSVIVEGGKELLQSFVDESLWDEARILKSERNFEQGLSSPELPIQEIVVEKVGNDELRWIYNTSAP